VTAMAIFSALTHRSLELYRKVFPIPCLLCGLTTERDPLCQACIADLANLGPACKRCALPLESAQICGRCLRKPPPQHASFSLLRYQGGVKRCITGFKFHQQLAFANLFAKLMSEQLRHRDTLPDCLIPIPLHPVRLRRRGFNQSLEVARQLGKTLNIACRPDLLKRVKATRAQSDLKFKQRKANLHRAFQCTSTTLPEHIALLDDVMTSGHTSAEAAKTLLNQGAKCVEVWTIARAIRHY